MTLFFQFFIHHGASAVFYNDDLPVEPLDIRQCLDQDFRFFHDFFHILFFQLYILRCYLFPYFSVFLSAVVPTRFKNGNPH